MAEFYARLAKMFMAAVAAMLLFSSYIGGLMPFVFIALAPAAAIWTIRDQGERLEAMREGGGDRHPFPRR